MRTSFKVCLLVLLGQLLIRCTPITLDSGINLISGPLSSHTDTSITEIFRHNLGTVWYDIYAHEIKVGWAKATKRERKGLSERCYRINLTGELRLQLNGNSHPIKFEIEENYAIQPPYEIKRFYTKEKIDNIVTKKMIFKTSHGYQMEITRGSETQKQTIGDIPYTLHDALIVESWIQKEPSVGDFIQVEELNTETFKVETALARLRDIRIEYIGDQPMRLYEIVLTNNSKDELVRLYREDQTIEKRDFDGFFKFVRADSKRQAKKFHSPVDLYVKLMVKVDRVIGNSDKVKRLKLSIKGLPDQFITNSPGQTVERDSKKNRYFITIDQINGYRQRATDHEIKLYSSLTNDITENRSKLIKMAQQAVKDSKTTEEQVACLVKYVDEYVKDDEGVLSPDLKYIINKKKGDCSEHSELFTALARSIRIPCRSVSGLIYAGDWGKYYSLHAWNEVVVNGTWMSVDPSRGKPEITPLYIRFSQDHDKEVKILSYIPEMKIEILAVDLDE